MVKIVNIAKMVHGKMVKNGEKLVNSENKHGKNSKNDTQ